MTGIRRLAAAVAVAALLSLGCISFVSACPPALSCLRIVFAMGGWIFVHPLLSGVFAFVAIGSWAVRTGMILLAAEQGLRGLTTAPVREAMRAGQTRTGARRVVCLAGDSESAFCTGTWRPTIFIGDGVAGRLNSAELDAVLLHELDHAKRFEPVRRAARQAAADLFFFAPLVAWWAQRRLVQVELGADRAALRQVGPRALASAILTLGESVETRFAAFGGATGH